MAVLQLWQKRVLHFIAPSFWRRLISFGNRSYRTQFLKKNVALFHLVHELHFSQDIVFCKYFFSLGVSVTFAFKNGVLFFPKDFYPLLGLLSVFLNLFYILNRNFFQRFVDTILVDFRNSILKLNVKWIFRNNSVQKLFQL